MCVFPNRRHIFNKYVQCSNEPFSIVMIIKNMSLYNTLKKDLLIFSLSQGFWGGVFAEISNFSLFWVAKKWMHIFILIWKVKEANYQASSAPLLREDGGGVPTVPESSSTANEITSM